MDNFYAHKKRLAVFFLSAVGLISTRVSSQTPCTAVATISEDFSSFPVGTSFFPMNCWGFVKEPSTISGMGYIADDGVTSPNNVAVIMGNVNQVGGRYLISPPLSTINGNYRLKFDARLLSSLGTGSTLQIGTLDSQTNVANFSPVGSLINNLTTSYQTFTSIAVPATTGHQYIAIKLNPGGTTSAVYIDNIVWEPLNTPSPCTAVSSFYENFDSPSLTCCNMGVVPQCWNSLSTANGANQIISNSSPASGTNNIYQFGYGPNLQSIVIMPPVNNINAGTHQFKFKLRANSGPGNLDFGYITNATDASTFVVIQTISVTNSSYNDPTAERTLTVPTTVPSTARLAIRNPGTSWAGFYWDDASWDQIPTAVQSVSVNTQNNIPATIGTPNGTLQIEATVNPSTVSQNVSWSVQTGNNFASVDNSGLVTAIANGVATIRATSVADPTKYAEIAVTVNMSTAAPCTPLATIDEDFENFTTIPENCWTTNKTAPQIDIDIDSATNNHSVSLYSYFNAADPIYLVSPELTTIDGNHLLEFDIVSSNATASNIEIGTMSDNTDFSTFIAVGNSFNPTVGNHTSAVVPAVPGHKYVAIKFIPNAVHQALSIDNVKWTTTAGVPGFDQGKVNVYPNPTTGMFYVESQLNIQYIEVYNSLGQRVLKTDRREIDLHNASNGVYLITITTADGAKGTYKLIKK